MGGTVAGTRWRCLVIVVAAPLIVVSLMATGLLWFELRGVDAYRELGPQGRKASCGSVFRPLEPYSHHDEICVDQLQPRRHIVRLIWITGTIALAVAAGCSYHFARRTTEADPHAAKAGR
jgi:hypothetical protein